MIIEIPNNYFVTELYFDNNELYFNQIESSYEKMIRKLSNLIYNEKYKKVQDLKYFYEFLNEIEIDLKSDSYIKDMLEVSKFSLLHEIQNQFLEDNYDDKNKILDFYENIIDILSEYLQGDV